MLWPKLDGCNPHAKEQPVSFLQKKAPTVLSVEATDKLFWPEVQPTCRLLINQPWQKADGGEVHRKGKKWHEFNVSACQNEGKSSLDIYANTPEN